MMKGRSADGCRKESRIADELTLMRATSSGESNRGRKELRSRYVKFEDDDSDEIDMSLIT